MDVHDEKTRSYNMSRIRGKDTKPELLLRRALHRRGFRYSLNKKGLPGKPDIYLRKYNAAIFVHGCFWHAHGVFEGNPCPKFRWPKKNADFWREKITGNVRRDTDNVDALRQMGIRVAVVFECELSRNAIDSTLEETVSWLRTEIPPHASL